MSPIRRYLRITKYSVLEVRIFLDQPSDAAWLLSSREPVLQRIIDEIRPKVLPKLREENENAKKKGGKKKRGIKDVVSQEDFEVTIFLTEISTRHSLLTKQKQFSDKPKIKATGSNLTGWLNTSDHPMCVDDDAVPDILREDGDAAPKLHDIPDVQTGSKRKAVETDPDDALFVSSSDEDTFQTQRQAPQRRKQKLRADEPVPAAEVDEERQDDKKKLALNTSYDGFSIYGRILCLLVKRKGQRPKQTHAPTGGSQMMEQWVSTQAAQEGGIGDDDEG